MTEVIELEHVFAFQVFGMAPGHRHLGHNNVQVYSAFATLITLQPTSMPFHACQQVRMK